MFPSYKPFACWYEISSYMLRSPQALSHMPCRHAEVSHSRPTLFFLSYFSIDYTTSMSTVVLDAPQVKLTKRSSKFYFPSLFMLPISLDLTNSILGQASLVYDALTPLPGSTSPLCSSCRRPNSQSSLNIHRHCAL